MNILLKFAGVIVLSAALAGCQTTNISSENVKLSPETSRLDLSKVTQKSYNHTVWAWGSTRVYVEYHSFVDTDSETGLFAGFTARQQIWTATDRPSDFYEEMQNFSKLEGKSVDYGKIRYGDTRLGPLMYSYGTVGNETCAFGLAFFSKSFRDSDGRFRGKMRFLSCNHNRAVYDRAFVPELMDKIVVRDAAYNGDGVPDPNATIPQ